MHTAIFDMDGVLIDSEPLWRSAEMKVFSRLGLEMTEDMCFQVTGLRTDEVVNYWYQRHPWPGDNHEQVVQDLYDEVKREILVSGQAMPGVYSSLELMKSMGLRIALASSSSMELIRAVIDHLQITQYFEVLCTAEEEEKGKPDPAVYLSTISRLGVEANQCFALEDSFYGVKSAIAAGMKVIAIPTLEERDDPKFDIADHRLSSLSNIDEAWLRGFIAGR